MQQERTRNMPWIMLGSAFLLSSTMGLSTFCVPPMEHIIKEEFLLTHAQTSLLMVIPVIVMAAISIPSGFLADRIGIRKAAGIGAILAAIGAALRGTTTDFPVLLVFTAIFGAGQVLIMPNLPKLVSLWVPNDRAGTATGIYSSGLAVGCALPIAITLPVIFPITGTVQGTFFIWSIPTIIATIMWWIVVKDAPHRSTTASEVVKQDSVSIRQILRNKVLWLVAIYFLLMQFFHLNWSTWAPALMMERGASPDLAAFIASFAMWLAIPTLLLFPRLSDKLRIRKPFLWIPPTVLALASFWAIQMTVPMGWYVMALVGISYNTLLVIVRTLPIEIMPREAVATASGLVMSVGATGGIIGPIIGGHILDITGSLNLSLTILIGITLSAAAVASRIPETGPKANLKD